MNLDGMTPDAKVYAAHNPDQPHVPLPRNREPFFDYSEVSEEYPNATVLPHKTESLHAFRWHRVMAGIGWLVILAASFFCMQAAGCFDRFHH